MMMIKKIFINVEALAIAFLLALLCISSAAAEIRTITATGEYRMGDNDTRTDANRLALLDAKRLALEQAGIYIESITQVNNFALSRDEIRAYTAGIIKVMEQVTRSEMEGQQQVVRVDVVAQVDTDVVASQIDKLRKNETAKAELVKLKEENERFRKEIEQKTRQLGELKPQAEVESLTQRRQQMLTHLDVDELLRRALVALAGAESTSLMMGASTLEGRNHAKALVEKALRLDPSNAAAHAVSGLILHEDKQHQAAITEYRKALASRRNTGSTDYLSGLHFLIGQGLQDMGKFDEAITEYRLAVMLEPNNAELHHWLGQTLLYDKGDSNGAIPELRTAVQLTPKRADFHRTLGEAFLEVDLDAAINEYRTAILLKPNDAEYHKLLGSALLPKGDREGMISEYYLAARLKPEEASTIHWQLGFALQHDGDTEAAIREYRRSLDLDPTNSNSAYDLALVFVDTGNWEPAYRQFRAMKRYKDLWEPLAYYSFGDFLQGRGRRSQAVRAYQEALNRASEVPDTKGLIEAAQRKLAELKE